MGLPCFSIMRIEKQGDFLWREKEMEQAKEKEKKMEKAKEMEKKMDVEISKMVNAIAARLG